MNAKPRALIIPVKRISDATIPKRSKNAVEAWILVHSSSRAMSARVSTPVINPPHTQRRISASIVIKTAIVRRLVLLGSVVIIPRASTAKRRIHPMSVSTGVTDVYCVISV